MRVALVAAYWLFPVVGSIVRLWVSTKPTVGTEVEALGPLQVRLAPVLDESADGPAVSSSFQ